MDGPRNVLLVTVDCLRADRFREAVESGLCPTFAELDDAGTSFEAAYTVANTTDPSLTSFMTGQYPLAHGVVENGWGLSADEPVAAERFRAAGFDTFGVVSVDHLANEHSGLGRGFDRYVDGGSRYDALYPVLSRIYDTKAFNTAFGAVKDVGLGRYTVKNLLRDLGLIQLHCRTATSVTADAVEQLEAASPPFFGWVHYFDVHEPRNAPGEFLADHDEYTAAMMHVDRQVGRLLDALEAAGHREDTLIVLTGDHGEALDDHGYTGHGRTLYDEELHVPLVFAHDTLPSESVPTQVRTIDILPTLLDLVGAAPMAADGEPLFDDGPVRTDRAVYSMAYPTFREQVAVRTDGWKLVRDRETGAEELYQPAADPDERRDHSATTDGAGGGAESPGAADDQDAAVDPDAGAGPDAAEVRARHQSLSSELDAWLAGFEETENQEVDAETEAMLADLGYRE